MDKSRNEHRRYARQLYKQFSCWEVREKLKLLNDVVKELTIATYSRGDVIDNAVVHKIASAMMSGEYDEAYELIHKL